MLKAFALLFILLSVSARSITVEVRMENLAPEFGSNLTPLWVGFHDGTYDTFSSGSAASSALESLAEDGATDGISSAFTSASSNFMDRTIVADNSDVPVVQFGQTATMQIVIDTDIHRYASLLSMVVPSNDAFVGNGNPLAYKIIDDDDNFQDVTAMWMGGDVYDAGTEVNDELTSTTAFFGQAAPNTGTDENGVVFLHEGLNAAGSGGIVDDSNFRNADFSGDDDDDDYMVGRVTIREVTAAESDDDDDSVSANDDDDDSVSANDDDDESVSANDDDDESASADDDDESASANDDDDESASANDDDDESASANDDDDDNSSSASTLIASLVVVVAALF